MNGLSPRTVLVVAPGLGPATDTLCKGLLAESKQDEHVLGITVGSSPERRLEHWRSHLDLATTTLEFIDIEAQTRSTAETATDSDVPASSREEVQIQQLEDPTDLAGLGRAIGDRIDELDGDLTICLDSLSDLLQYVEREAALQFLHTLSVQVMHSGATAHYHLDSTIHDSDTIDLFSTVTDRVYSADDEPGVSNTRA